jgi:tetratricopeptide (TPR) repeat protein
MKRWICLILAALLILAIAGIAGYRWRETSRARNTAQRVRTLLYEGRLDDAAVALEQWMKTQPDAAELHYLKARLALAHHDLRLLQDELTRARALGYPVVSLAGLRGVLLARANHTSEAEPLLRNAAENSEKLDPEIAEVLAQIYLGSFRLGRATDLLNRWIKDWPGDARPYFLQTEIDARNHGSADVLIAHCKAALQRDPAYHQARLRLADTLRLSHHNTEAATEYATYLTCKPNDPMGFLGAAQNELYMGKLAECVHYLDQALALSPHDPEILAAHAVIDIRLGHLDTARQYLDQAVQADPFNYNNRYQRMLLLTRQGKKQEAEAERLKMDQIRQDEAEFARISRQLESRPLDFQLRSQAARWLIDHGHEAEAIDWAKLVLESVPADPAMNRLLANYYRKQGNLGLTNFYEAHASPMPH